jgi:hypothetical protein
MAVPGLLIEYLINGALALIWIYPLAKNHGLSDLSPSYLVLLALGLYFIGMVVDIVAWKVTRPIKRIIRTKVEKKYGFESQQIPGGSHMRQAKFALYAPEIAKESNMRSSRDRIARGAIINSIMATIFLFHWLLGVALIIISFVMWVGFERVSYGYEIIAEKKVDEKIQNLSNKSLPNNGIKTDH